MAISRRVRAYEWTPVLDFDMRPLGIDVFYGGDGVGDHDEGVIKVFDDGGVRLLTLSSAWKVRLSERGDG